MKDFVYIISFTSINKEEADFSICCKADKFSLSFSLMKQIIVHYTSHVIPFNVSIDCYKPIIINNVKK